ncbi:MAG: ammonium transporter [Prochlorotrichaceae cyanobacterium]
MVQLTAIRRRNQRTTTTPGAFRIERLTRELKRLFPSFTWSWAACVPLVLLLLGIWNVSAHAQEGALTPEDVQATLDNIWILVAAILVIFMNAGFAMLETGLCRQKNAVNILAKNLIVFALASLAFWAIGFSLMFGSSGGGFMGAGGFFLSGDKATYGLDESTLEISVFFLFQVAFTATAATIVSGAVAERIKFVDFLIFSVLLTGIAYPISGHWVWGGGMLSDIGFLGGIGFSDFAGSTVVHSVGGWAALVGAALLGPRIGKYREDGTPTAIPGHNMSLATLGCLILWIGWFGFNPGSQLAADSAVPYIAVTTALAGSAGGVTATFTSWISTGKPDLSMVINGILAGLVGITAGCAGASFAGAVIIGGIAGVIVVFSVIFIDSTLKIDDPVGALSVHLVNGIWGTLAVGLFDQSSGLLYGHGPNQLIAQILGILTIGGFTVLVSFIFWGAIKAVLGMRVTEEEELIGLDIGEHGMEAYSGFLKDTSGMSAMKSE